MIGVPLVEVVEDLCIEQERDTMHYKSLYLHLGINCLRDLFRKADGTMKMEKLNIDSTYIAPLPTDLIKICRVFWVGRNGEVIALSENTSMYGATDYAGNAYAPFGDWGYSIDDYYASHFVNGENIGGWFGQGGGSVIGEYRWDKANNRIEFSRMLQAVYLFVEYIGDVVPINGQYRVHPYLRPVVKNYIDWMSNARKSGVSGGEKQRLKNEYYQSLFEAKMELFGLSQDQANDIDSQTRHQAPKGF